MMGAANFEENICQRVVVSSEKDIAADGAYVDGLIERYDLVLGGRNGESFVFTRRKAFLCGKRYCDRKSAAENSIYHDSSTQNLMRRQIVCWIKGFDLGYGGGVEALE